MHNFVFAYDHEADTAIMDYELCIVNYELKQKGTIRE
jgi:hypothetical protein